MGLNDRLTREVKTSLPQSKQHCEETQEIGDLYLPAIAAKITHQEDVCLRIKEESPRKGVHLP